MRILIVDNDEKNLAFFEGLLEHAGHDVIKAKDGTSALSLAGKEPVEAVLLAAVMPGISGFDAARRIKAERPVPVVLISGLREKDDILLGLKSGVDAFIFKPYIREEVQLLIKNLETVKGYQDTLNETIERRTGYLREIIRKTNDLNREMVFRLLAASEYKDNTAGNHALRVGRYARIIAQGMGFKGEFLDLIESASALHDIGKIGIPDRILLKAGALSGKEFEVMKSHTTIGSAIFGGSKFPLINMAGDIALSHHEKWDGSGYPHGKKGEKIPVTGRITALADVFDIVTSPRPYKPPFSWERSIITVKEYRGKHFDPHAVDSFINRIVEIEKVYKELHDPEAGDSNEDVSGIENIR